MKKAALLIVLAVFGVSSAFGGGDAVIRSGDTFDLRIGGIPNTDAATVNGSYTIDSDGNLNLPYLGKIAVANMSPSQVQSSAERAYINQGIYTHPTITITLAPSARFVNVGGQVKAPQRVSYTADMTVLSAITSAGDFNEFADQKHVRLIRGGKVTVVNCKAIRADPTQDLKVSPGDQIQVPQSIFF